MGDVAMRLPVINDLFEKWIVASPDGREFQVMPWEAEEFSSHKKLPFYKKPYRAPSTVILWTLLALTLSAYLFNLPVAGAIGAGGLTLWILACRDSWVQSGALSIQANALTFRAHEHEDFPLRLKVKNQSPRKLNTSYLFIKFPGTTKQHQVFCLTNMEALEERFIDVQFKLNAGMGVFRLLEIPVLTRDQFGLLPHCVTHAVDVTVEVMPEYATMPPLKLDVAGKTAHSGTVEARMSGDSASFLGLRPYRHGDSIRRIDWRKSERFDDLIVREFERLNSTDAIIFIDQRTVGAFEFEGLKSYEHLKDTVITLCRTLMEQRLRVKIITPGIVTEFGKGDRFFEYISDLVRDLNPTSVEPYDVFLKNHRELVPAYSLVIPIFSAIDINLKSLLECFWMWDSIRAQVIPVAIDIPLFDQKISASANFDNREKRELNFLRQLYGGLSNGQPFENLARKISEKTIVIGPGETIGQVYERSSRWNH